MYHSFRDLQTYDSRFRWASLQLQALQRCRKDESILERLGRLPRTLAESYQEIISRIDSYEAESDKRIAKTALSWLLCGEKQFQSHDFLAAVSTTEDPSAPVLQQDVLLDLCCNFVVFDSPLDVFRFAHLSVAEFGPRGFQANICECVSGKGLSSASDEHGN